MSGSSRGIWGGDNMQFAKKPLLYSVKVRNLGWYSIAGQSFLRVCGEGGGE